MEISSGIQESMDKLGLWDVQKSHGEDGVRWASGPDGGGAVQVDATQNR